MSIPLPPMAIRITVDTYPLAVACLPPVFATIRTGKVLDHYLVINELGVKFHKGGRQTLTISNGWMSEKLFFKTYAFCDEDHLAGSLQEVYKIS